LFGLVTLGSRRNALGFSEDDFRFVRAAAAAASLACDAIASEGRRADATSTDGLDEVALQCLRCGDVQGWAKDAVLCSCGGSWEPAALPKRVLERFDLSEWLGAGGMGVVYRALDLTLGRDVALKTLPQLSAGAAERLIAEARAMASLSHDDVAVLYEVAVWRGTPLLVMEYLAGGTLAGRLRESRLADAELVALVRQLALALGRVHARGLYHGDVKPSNIGFGSDGAPKLLDFGLARALTADDASDSAAPAGRAPLGGTWAYLAPEVRDGAAPGARLDLWALGVVLCEGLLGEHPFPRARSREEVVVGRALALAQLRRSRSDAHHRTVEHVLALEPAERPATAAEFADLLAALA
jgi:serine/threonine protein kinase